MQYENLNPELIDLGKRAAVWLTDESRLTIFSYMAEYILKKNKDYLYQDYALELKQNCIEYETRMLSLLGVELYFELKEFKID